MGSLLPGVVLFPEQRQHGDEPQLPWPGPSALSVAQEVLQNHVLEAKVFHTEYGTGVAILTGAHRFSLTTNIDDLKLRRMPEVPGASPPRCPLLRLGAGV